MVKKQNKAPFFVAHVAPAVPLRKILHYEVPPSLHGAVEVGSMVSVPLGNRRVTGYVIDVVEASGTNGLKVIERVLDPVPVFLSADLKFLQWAANYYCCPLGEVLKNALPAGIKEETISHVCITPEGERALETHGLAAESRALLQRLADKKDMALTRLKESEGLNFSNKVFDGLLHKEFIRLIQKQRAPLVRGQKEKVYRINQEDYSHFSLSQWRQLRRRAPRQYALLKWLRRVSPVSHSDVLAQQGAMQQVLKALLEKELIVCSERERFRTPLMDDYYEVETGFDLTSHQKKVLKEILPAVEQRRYASFLLHGVTGSGKTEVYLQAIEAAVRAGRGAIMLVPEIALTPQFIALFVARFGTEIAQIHSGLSQGERYDEWRRIRNGQARIVVGARSAIFAPVKDIGIIVVDEEHDGAYKQDQRFCYHARDLALVRGSMSAATVILGSATPMLETFYNTKIRKLQYLSLDQRIDNRPLPQVDVVDMRNEQPGTILSASLKEAISRRWKRGEQTLLFLNRRGFARFVLCRHCGHTFQCPNCAVSLIYHQSNRSLRCHYCNHVARAPKNCPQCAGSKLSVFGFGTERVQTEVNKWFPDMRIARLDRDTITRKDSLRKILKQFRRGKTDLLIGTQMIALGHDLPGVTLVGILAADVSLNIPDFRAGERTFQLLTQVAGRSGRGKIAGNVVIQTYNPHYSSIQQAIKQDFLSFYDQELPQRKELDYPPFSRLVNIRVSGKRKEDVQTQAVALGKRCRTLIQRNGSGYDSLEVLGPTAAPWEKLKGKYRWHMLVKGTDREALNRFTHHLVESVIPRMRKSGVIVGIDIDPVNLN